MSLSFCRAVIATIKSASLIGQREMDNALNAGPKSIELHLSADSAEIPIEISNMIKMKNYFGIIPDSAQTVRD
jgi:hypothetical protein